MDYKVTCVCGHSFLLPEDKVRGVVQCPACGQRLSPAIEMPTRPAESAPVPVSAPPVSAAAAAPPEMVLHPVSPLFEGSAAASVPPASLPMAPAEPTKRCPYCGEVILAIARKCKHCGEFLDREAFPPATAGQTPGTGGAHAGAASSAAATGDEVAFSLATSQWDNFWKYLTLASIVVFVAFVFWFFKDLHPYLAVVVLGALVIAGFVGWFFYLGAKSTHIIIRPLRLDIEQGILSKNITSLEYFRVSDIALDQGFVPRMLGFGTIRLTTTDADSPELVLFHIPRAGEVRKYLQAQVPLAARQRGAVYMEK